MCSGIRPPHSSVKQTPFNRSKWIMRKGLNWTDIHKGQNEKQITDRANTFCVSLTNGFFLCERNESATNPFGTIIYIICVQVQVYECESHIPFLFFFWAIFHSDRLYFTIELCGKLLKHILMATIELVLTFFFLPIWIFFSCLLHSQIAE